MSSAETSTKAGFFGRRIPFLDLIGLRPGRLDGGKCSAELDFRPDLANSAGKFHGGALTGALDSAMAFAARSALAAEVDISTIDMHVSFLSAADGRVVIEAQCLKAGKSVAYCEAYARDDQGKIAAKASAAFSIRTRAKESTIQA